MKLMMKFWLCLHKFSELWNSFSLVSMGNCFRCYLRQLFMYLPLRKCKNDYKILKIILVPDFCPLKPEIARFSIGFRLKVVWKCQYSFIYLGTVHTTPEKFENAALFLRLGPVPSTLIRHQNEAFRNALQTGEIWRRRLFVFAWTENILKTELFENDGVTIIMWFPWPSFPETQIQNDW